MFREYIPSHDFPNEGGHSVSPHKVWTDIFPKAFHGKCGTTFLLNLLWDCYIWGINNYIMPSLGDFPNSFCNNVKTVDVKIFVSHEGVYT